MRENVLLYSWVRFTIGPKSEVEVLQDINTRPGFIRKSREQRVCNQVTEDMPHDHPSYVIVSHITNKWLETSCPAGKGSNAGGSVEEKQAVVAGPGAVGQVINRARWFPLFEASYLRTQNHVGVLSRETCWYIWWVMGWCPIPPTEPHYVVKNH